VLQDLQDEPILEEYRSLHMFACCCCCFFPAISNRIDLGKKEEERREEKISTSLPATL
jgi:hypothetical protein